jgi:ABC-type multidrug transport system ATPase subunit
MNSMIRPDAPAIKVSGLNKRFGRKAALAGMEFSIPRGAVAGFLGPNGAGKTTTLRILLGLLRADAGTSEMLGLAMPAGRSAALAQVGALVEKPTFIENLSGYQNLWWFGSLNAPLATARIHEVLGLVGLTEAAHQSFGTYSTGMKQRLGVGFALLHRPALLILDEPTNGMDPQGRVHMRDILREIHAKEQTTIFLSSHLLDEIQRLCDYVVIAGRGRMVREGYVREILRNDREAWEIRLEGFPTGTGSTVEPGPGTEAGDGAGVGKTALADASTPKGGPDLSPAQLQAQAQALTALGPISGVLDARVGPRGLDVWLQPGRSAAVNRALVEAGVPVSALIPREASLEETFLALTNEEGEP